MVQVGNDQGKKFPLQKPRWKKLNLQLGKPSEQLFPNRRPLSYPNLHKNMTTYIKFNSTKIQLQNIKQMD